MASGNRNQGIFHSSIMKELHNSAAALTWGEKFSDVAVHFVGRSLSMHNRMKDLLTSASYAGMPELGNISVPEEKSLATTSCRPLYSIRSALLGIAANIPTRTMIREP